MKIYYCIGSFYGGQRLDTLLDALRSRTGPSYSILVDEQRGVDRQPRGFANVYNALLACAFTDPQCDIAWIMGDDVIPVGDCLELTESFLSPTVGAVFPVEAWGTPPMTIIPFGDGKQVPIAEALKQGPAAIEQVFAGFACACVSRQAWQAVGHMDPSLGLGYCEDLDWGLRCWQAGFKVLNYRRAWFHHERGATFNQMIQDGLFTKEAPYEAAELAKVKWSFLWKDTNEEIMTRLRSWYDAARGDK